jgi:prevent-host-death family protein
MFVHSTNHKGAVAEAVITVHAIKLGVDVLKPVAEHARYDLAFDLGERIIKVQCKWAPRKGDVVYVHLAGYRMTSRGSVRSTYGPHEIDAVAVYCEDLDRVYLLPMEVVANRTAVQLRLSPPRNGQKAAVNWGPDFELPGAVAQLGRACGWQPQGRGFESRQLHHSTQVTVQANPFRDRLGYWMERAASGDEILITRHGRPFARLGPPDPRHATTDIDADPEQAAVPAAPLPRTAGISR